MTEQTRDCLTAIRTDRRNLIAIPTTTPFSEPEAAQPLPHRTAPPLTNALFQAPDFGPSQPDAPDAFDVTSPEPAEHRPYRRTDRPAPAAARRRPPQRHPRQP